MVTMRNLLLYFGFTLLLIFGWEGADGQTIEELRAQHAATKSRIEEARKLLASSSASEKSSLEQISLLSSEISARNELLRNLSEQANHFERALAVNMRQIDSLQQSIATLKSQYAAFLRQAQFRTGKPNIIVYILASETFGQMYRRIRFYREYLTFQQQQYEAILAAEKRLHIVRGELKKNEQEILAIQSENEKARAALEHSQQNYQREVNRLQARQQELAKEIASGQQQMASLQAAINKLLEQERKRNLASRRDANYTELSANFVKNRGKLPWPVHTGAITRGYGLKRSEVYRNIQTNSEGIYITTEASAPVYPVFSGRVTLISEISGQNMTIIVRHGDYLSLYSNLVDVKVKQNDVVTIDTMLGHVHCPAGNQRSVLHFEIWKSGKDRPKSENPQNWLRR